MASHAFAPLALKKWAHARVLALVLAFSAALGLTASPLAAQDLETFDPDQAFEAAETARAASAAEASSAIDADLVDPAAQALPVAAPLPAGAPSASQASVDEEFAIYSETPDEADTAAASDNATAALPVESDAEIAANDATYAEDDLIGAAEGVFGKGAEGLARMIANLLEKEGRPNGYIVGREAGGAFVVGARYGSGTLHHKVEGERKVYWTGPSVGFDAGANAANTFVLVYNLWDSEDLFKRYPAGEGQAYFIGGLHASYVRRGDVVLIPIRMGAGVRLGVNAGYMRFSKKHRWLPF